MSAERVEIRASGIHDVGVRMDDLLDGAEKEVLRCEGAALGLLQATKAVNDLLGHVETDLTEGKFDNITEALEVAKLIKLYVSRAVQVVSNLGMNANNQKMIASGQVQAMQTVVAVTKKMFDSEMARKEVIKMAEEEPGEIDLRSRPTGVRPPMSLKEQRLAEDRAEDTLVDQTSISSNGSKRRKKG